MWRQHPIYTARPGVCDKRLHTSVWVWSGFSSWHCCLPFVQRGVSWALEAFMKSRALPPNLHHLLDHKMNKRVLLVSQLPACTCKAPPWVPRPTKPGTPSAKNGSFSWSCQPSARTQWNWCLSPFLSQTSWPVSSVSFYVCMAFGERKAHWCPEPTLTTLWHHHHFNKARRFCCYYL